METEDFSIDKRINASVIFKKGRVSPPKGIRGNFLTHIPLYRIILICFFVSSSGIGMSTGYAGKTMGIITMNLFKSRHHKENEK